MTANTNILWEYRSHQKRTGAPNLLSKDEFEGLGGFISVFGFGPEAAHFVSQTGRTSGIGSFPLYADTLYLDFDDNEEAMERSTKTLYNLGNSFRLYDTGGRGYHIHIPIVPIHRVGLNYYMKKVCADLFPGADLSIFKSTGVIRLPGTYHSKTGKSKVLKAAYTGKVMNIDDHRPKNFVPVKQYYEEDDDQLRYWLLQDITMKVGQGDRNNHAFHIAATCCRLKMPKLEAASMVEDWNREYCCPPLGVNEVKAVLNSVYRRN